MLTIEPFLIKPAKRGALTKCLPIPPLKTNDLRSMREAFGPVPGIALGQTWLEKAENDFAPGNVRIGWRGNFLFVFAELLDADIFNLATGHNQRTWELGDSFEIFLQPVEHTAYVEFQVTPNNQRVQLRYTDGAALEHLRKTGSMESVLMPGDRFRSRTWIRSEAQRWYVYAEIRAVDLGDQAGSLEGRQWRYSFSRYDYTSGCAKPVISSTSRHSEPDFHRQHEWGTISFEAFKINGK